MTEEEIAKRVAEMERERALDYWRSIRPEVLEAFVRNAECIIQDLYYDKSLSVDAHERVGRVFGSLVALKHNRLPGEPEATTSEEQK